MFDHAGVVSLLEGGDAADNHPAPGLVVVHQRLHLYFEQRSDFILLRAVDRQQQTFPQQTFQPGPITGETRQRLDSLYPERFQPCRP